MSAPAQRLDYLLRQMARSGRRPVSERVARDVLLELQEVAAIVALHRPVHDTLATTVVHTIDRVCGRDPMRDYDAADKRRTRRIEVAMAGGGR